MLIYLGISALIAFGCALTLLLIGEMSLLASTHLVLAVGVLPLIFGAIAHFVPVLTRSGAAPRAVWLAPLLLQLAGVLVFLHFSGMAGNAALHAAAAIALVASLGDNNAMILRNHGLLTTGATIPEAFNAMHRLELSCKTQIAAMSCNTKLIQVPPEVVEATYMNYQPKTRRPFGLLDWPALLRKLDRIDPGFRD